MSLLDRDTCQGCNDPLWFSSTYVIKTDDGVPKKLCEKCFSKHCEASAASQGDQP